VVELSTNRVERVAPGSSLHSPNGVLHVVTASALPRSTSRPRWLVTFEGVTNRDQAELLRGVPLQALPLHDSKAWWVHELIGATVVDRSGAVLGIVEAVEANPASDLLVLDNGGLIPLTFVVERQPGRLTAELPPGLLDS
jgi:16S rRNA processing protein RimM